MGDMKRKTIRNHKDFFVSCGNLKSAADYFMLKAKPAKIPGDARYGLIITKKTFKSAVLRNRAKRMMRDWIAFNEHWMSPDLDYVFILYASVLKCDRELGRKTVAKSLKRVAKTHRKMQQAALAAQNAVNNAQIATADTESKTNDNPDATTDAQ